MEKGQFKMHQQLLNEPESVSSDFPENRSERSVIVVIGMHRSGTSLCSNVLGLLGVHMADEVGDNLESNPLGHFERWEIMELQDEVLSLFDRSYYSPTHDYPLPPAWWADFRLRPIKDRLKSYLTTIMSNSDLFGFKDPRTTRLMPMWFQIFAELHMHPRFIVCLRNPAHVAVSLNARDKLELKIGEMRALDYVVDALRYTRGRDRCFIRYEDWMLNPMLNATKLLHFINSPVYIEARDLELAVRAVVRPEANRSGRTELEARQPFVRNFFNLVNSFAESNGADPAIDSSIESFIHSYTAFRQMLAPFESQFKEIASERSEIQAKLASTLQQLAQAQQALAAERALAEKSKEALLAAQTKAQQLETALAEKVKRIEALTAAAATCGSEGGPLPNAQATVT